MPDNMYIKQSPSGELLLILPMDVPEGELTVCADKGTVRLLADGQQVADIDRVAPDIVRALGAQDGIWIIRDNDGEPDMIPDPAHRAAISPAGFA